MKQFESLDKRDVKTVEEERVEKNLKEGLLEKTIENRKGKTN